MLFKNNLNFGTRFWLFIIQRVVPNSNLIGGYHMIFANHFSWGLFIFLLSLGGQIFRVSPSGVQEGKGSQEKQEPFLIFLHLSVKIASEKFTINKEIVHKLFPKKILYFLEELQRKTITNVKLLLYREFAGANGAKIFYPLSTRNFCSFQSQGGVYCKILHTGWFD